jgi:prevent-host-death family protein
MPRTISQREFRNASAAIMDAVEAGETVIVTRNGVAVAELRPVQRRTFAASADLLRSFRDLPPLNYDTLRADADALFGEDALDG